MIGCRLPLSCFLTMKVDAKHFRSLSYTPLALGTTGVHPLWVLGVGVGGGRGHRDRHPDPCSWIFAVWSGNWICWCLAAQWGCALHLLGQLGALDAHSGLEAEG